MLLTYPRGFLLNTEYFLDQIPKASKVEKLSRHFTADDASQFVHMHRTVFDRPYLLTSSLQIKAGNSLSVLVKVAIISPLFPLFY